MLARFPADTIGRLEDPETTTALLPYSCFIWRAKNWILFYNKATKKDFKKEGSAKIPFINIDKNSKLSKF